MSAAASALLEARGVTRDFRVGGGLLGRSATLRAVDDVDLDVVRGEVLTVVGESGSGKTTLGRCLLGLMRPTAGTVRFDGAEVGTAGRARTSFRRRVQPIFQNPYSSLDPRWPVARTVREPLDAFGVGTRRDRDQRVSELLESVGLSERHAAARPHELSGGQRQRVAIAAALALGPDLIVADEPVSALDVLVQAQILNLICDLQRELGVALVFITHDLAVVEHIADRVAVMYLGRIVEAGPADEVLSRPKHPYTAHADRRHPSARPPPAARGRRRARRDPEPARTSAGLPFPPPLPACDRRLPEGRAGHDDVRGGPHRELSRDRRGTSIERSVNADRIRERHRHQLQAGGRRGSNGRPGQRPRRRPRDVGPADGRRARRRLPRSAVRQPRRRLELGPSRPVHDPALRRRRQGSGRRARPHRTST